MKVSQLIEELQKKDPNEHVLCLLYVKEDFENSWLEGSERVLKNWPVLAELLEEEIDHSQVYEILEPLIDYVTERYSRYFK